MSDDVLNDVFLRCVFERHDAKSRGRLRQAQRGRDLLVSHAKASHLFDGKEFLCGQDHSRCENAHKHYVFLRLCL